MAGGRGEGDYDDVDDDAPWLAEGVRETRSSTMVPRARLFGGIALFAALIVLVAVGVYVIVAKKQSGGSSGFARADEAPLIAADPGPYKIAPSDRGGMAVEGADDTIYAAGGGVDPGSSIDIGALPEEPLARPGTAAATGEPPITAPAPAPIVIRPPDKPVQLLPPIPKPVAVPPKAVPAEAPVATQPTKVAAAKPKPKDEAKDAAVTSPAKPKVKDEVKSSVEPEPRDDAKAKDTLAAPKPVGGPASLQLGAFSTSAKADEAWKGISSRFGYLAGLDKRVDKLDRDGTTLYRLRAGGVASKAAATDLCGRLKVAGQACLVAQ